MGRQSLNIARISPNSASHFRLRMADNPTGSETILPEEIKSEPEPEPELNPVEEFRKGKAKREYKRKEVKVITTHVPPEPEPVPAPPAPSIDAESIAGRVAEILLSKMGAEEDDVEEAEVKTKAKPKAPRPKKEVTPPPTRSFGWC